MLFVANTNSDTVSVIDTTKDKVVQTIETKPWPSSDVGYEPDEHRDDRATTTCWSRSAARTPSPSTSTTATPQEPVSYIGLLPTDYYPATVATVGDQIVVTNTRGIDARGPNLSFNKGQGTTVAVGHGTHSTTASLTRFTLPSDKEIAALHRRRSSPRTAGARTTSSRPRAARRRPVPVPTRIGDPSTIKHVFLLVKENRTYDQVYGDMGEGNGDPTLAQFGAKVTPNQHALAKQFGLYDNIYDVGTNSAEGHNWLMQGDNPEYTESSAGEYQRSYDTEEDVLGHQRSGFLWTAVEDAGNTARNYGEFEYTEGKPSGTWQQYYCAAKSVENGGDPAQLTAPDLKGNYGSVIPSLNAIADPQSPPFDTSIPDIYRYEIWKQDFEKNGPANFNMMWLSSDHTGGPTTRRPQVADGDLAVGKIVDTISHSQYWKDSAIFVVEDDSQDGADHVDGHRAPVQIISPWAQHGVVDSTYYSQITMVRTIEQILGAQPLNQKLAAATPMYGAFTNTPDYTPFNAVPNQVPLTEGIATAPACGLDTPGPDRRRRAGAEPGGGPEDRGARERAGHRRRLAGLARQAAHHRQRRDPRLREPGADEPVHVVPDPRLEGALPGRLEDLRSVAGSGRATSRARTRTDERLRVTTGASRAASRPCDGPPVSFRRAVARCRRSAGLRHG